MDTLDTPDLVQEAVQHQLLAALNERGHPWRTPVLANVDEYGLPQARTVVLRHVTNNGCSLQLFTDRRSPKSCQLQRQPAATLVFWHPELKWQLRVSGFAAIDSDSDYLQQIWRQLRDTSAAGDYLTAMAPGSPLNDAPAMALEHHQLAIITLSVERFDWLELSISGHRRARWGSGQPFEWLTP